MGDVAVISERCEFGNLIRYGEWRCGASDTVELAVLVVLHLLVQLLLNPNGVANILERLLAMLTRRLNGQGSRSHHAVDDALIEEHRVDAIEGNLDSLLGDDAFSVDTAICSHHKVGRDPGNPTLQKIQERPDHKQRRHTRGKVTHRPCGLPSELHESAKQDGRNQNHDPLRKHDPVRMKIQHNFFFSMQVVLAKWHRCRLSPRGRFRGEQPGQSVTQRCYRQCRAW